MVEKTKDNTALVSKPVPHACSFPNAMLVRIAPSEKSISGYANTLETNTIPVKAQIITVSQKVAVEDTNACFSASKTKLFNSGVCVGELDEKQTTAGVLIKRSVHDTDLAVKDVTIYGKRCDYMLRIINSKFKLKINLDGDKINVKIRKLSRSNSETE